MIRSIFAALLTLNILAANAEPGRSVPLPLAELANALALTAAQLAPAKAIVDIQHNQIRVLKAPNTEKHEQIRAATQASLAAVLSSQQMQKRHEFNASRRPPTRRYGGFDQHRAPAQQPRDIRPSQSRNRCQ